MQICTCIAWSIARLHAGTLHPSHTCTGYVGVLTSHLLLVCTYTLSLSGHKIFDMAALHVICMHAHTDTDKHIFTRTCIHDVHCQDIKYSARSRPVGLLAYIHKTRLQIHTSNINIHTLTYIIRASNVEHGVIVWDLSTYEACASFPLDG